MESEERGRGKMRNRGEGNRKWIVELKWAEYIEERGKGRRRGKEREKESNRKK